MTSTWSASFFSIVKISFGATGMAIISCIGEPLFLIHLAACYECCTCSSAIIYQDHCFIFTCKYRESDWNYLQYFYCDRVNFGALSLQSVQI